MGIAELSGVRVEIFNILAPKRPQANKQWILEPERICDVAWVESRESGVLGGVWSLVQCGASMSSRQHMHPCGHI